MMLSDLKEIPKQEEVPGNEVKPGKLLRCPQEGCGKVFRSSPGYRYHLKSHDLDPRPHVCSVCHKKFKSANGLKYHLRKAHHIEPVASKQNLNGGSSPKGRESISSEEDHLFNLNDNYTRGYINGSFSTDRTPSIPSPLVKSPMGLSSPLVKNLPPIPSPLIKSPIGVGPYLSSSSSGSGLQSPYTGKDRYSQFYDKRNGNDFSPRNSEYQREFSTRSSLSEYTQQCQQANNEFRQQCQRLSTGDLSNPRLPSLSDFPQRSCDYFRRPDSFTHGGPAGLTDFHKNSIDEPIYSSMNDVKLGSSGRLFSNSYKDMLHPNVGSKYLDEFANHNGDMNSTTCSGMLESVDKLNGHLQGYNNNNNNNIDYMSSSGAKTSCSLQNNEQIVPDISSPGCQVSPTGYDRNNNNAKNLRGASESSTETEFSDSVFQNENSNLAMSPLASTSNTTSPVLPSVSVKSEAISTGEPVFPASSVESMLQSPKSLLVRRTSRSKSIPPALVINPSPTVDGDCKTKDPKKMDPASRLRHLAEIATSPRSPYTHSPLPLSLTPGLLASESTPDWNLKSPSKFSFPDKSFLLTPTVSRSLGLEGGSSDIITSTHSLPQSPFLDNIQTPSFWPSQMWPTPVWLCFLKGCTVKFEQDDKEFMTSEEVADFCTTPGGRKRDNMNFYTSGMKIVLIKEQTSVNSARDIVELTFEQIIPGTQRLVAKCPIDHPFYVKHKGWSASNPTEAMARYGTPFRKLSQNDIVIQAPSNNMVTPGNTLSPHIKSTGAQVFTFNVQETKMFSQPKMKVENPTFSAPKAPSSLSVPTTIPASSNVKIEGGSEHASADSISAKSTLAPPSSLETITLTFSTKNSDASKQSSTQKLVNDFKSISEALKNKSKPEDSSKPDANGSSAFIDSSKKIALDGQPGAANPARKKRRKPLVGNEKDRRPMNGFMLFAKSMRVELTKEFPGKDNRAISKLLGERWRELSEEKREDFSRNAKEMADERMKLNPDCWKRKHRKDKDGKVDNEGPDAKKQRVHIEKADEFSLPSAFIESQGFIAPHQEVLAGKPQSFLSSTSSASSSSSTLTESHNVPTEALIKQEATHNTADHEPFNADSPQAVVSKPEGFSGSDISLRTAVKTEPFMSSPATAITSTESDGT